MDSPAPQVAATALLLASGVGPGSDSAHALRRARRGESYVGRASQILRLEGVARPHAGREEANMSAPNIRLRRQLQLAAYAHRMRSAPSEPERVLWQALRCNQLGVRFRRQVVVRGFIVDFFAPAARLVVEVDGAHHTRQRGADRRRDGALQAAGLTVLRVSAQLVVRNVPGALQLVAEALRR